MTTGKLKYYCLCMFPYPSGQLHMGHVRNYAIGDVLARYKKQRGYEVLYPMGWDAFGLPAENAAIAQQINPQEWVQKNIQSMRKQLEQLEFDYDWSRELCTSDPKYYRWGQWLFLQLWDHGLVYRKKSPVHWCNECHTVLANEQVLTNGSCWRHPHQQVEQKPLEQWYIKVTEFAEALYDDLATLEGHWPPSVIQMQRNWIGKQEGVEIEFACTNREIITVFSTRAETLFGVTYLAVGIEYPCLQNLAQTDKTLGKMVNFVAQHRATAKQDQNLEKHGLLLDVQAIHPYTKEKLPIFLVNFVVADYGSGAIMGVPAHDKRDWEFAQKQNLPIKPVIKAEEPLPICTSQGTMVDSGILNGLSCEQARIEILKLLEKDSLGRKKVQYRLRDWLISRQRYWGNPIPLIYCTRCFWVKEKQENLPILLPLATSITLGEKFLAQQPNFVQTPCPQCSAPAERETDTMDTFVCSSWYFLRYLNSTDTQKAFDPEEEKKWMPVDMYIGGVEHACLHLLYARFVTKFLCDAKFCTHKEPFAKLLTQGMVVNRSHYHTVEKKYFSEQELKERKIDLTNIVSKIEKMGKSSKNGVNPQHMIDQYGVDAVRLFVLFAAPPEKDLEWKEQGVQGCARFIKKVIVWGQSVISKSLDPCTISGEKNSTQTISELTKMFQKTLQKVTDNLEKNSLFNVCIANLMEFFNNISKFSPTTKEDTILYKDLTKGFLQMLFPFAPNCSKKLLLQLQETEFYWPTLQKDLLQEDTSLIMYQINGKVRAQQKVSKDLTKEALIILAKSHPTIIRWLENKSIQKEIVILNKLVNLVVQDCL